MNLKCFGAALAATALFAICLPASEAEAAKRKIIKNSATSYSYKSGPRTRIYVSRRSWLDAGTHVRPGERKFNDYAFPASNFSNYPLDSNGSMSRPYFPSEYYLRSH